MSEKKDTFVKNDLVEVRNIKAKGQGLFALKDIAMGEIIMREVPMIHMPTEIFDIEDMRDIEVWIDKKINKLDCKQREIFYDLIDSRSEDETKSTLGIFFTNCMDFGGDAAVFPSLAKANHSCEPNCDFVTRVDLGVQDMITLRNIKAGEEITFSYLPASAEGSDSKEVRQGYTREWYGFQCLCEICTLNGANLQASERLREKVREYQTKEPVELTLADTDDLCDKLNQIRCKASLQVEMNGKLFARALEENDYKMALKAFGTSWILDSIVNSHLEVNTWDFVLRSTFVNFGDQIVLFPA